MKFNDFFKFKSKNWLNSDEFDVNEGKTAGGGFIGGMLIFAPVAIVLSCLSIIVAAIGVPSSMEYLKKSLDSVNFSGKTELHAVAPEVLFDDVKPNSKYYDSLSYLKKNGVINGYIDRSFRPYQELKRAELLKIIVTAKKQFPLLLNYNSCFTDVKNEWSAPAICLAKEKGWVKGFEDGTFHPTETLTRAEALKMLVVAFDIRKKSDVLIEGFSDVKKDSWYFDYVQIALEKGLLNENPAQDLFKPDSLINRGDVAQILYRIMLL